MKLVARIAVLSLAAICSTNAAENTLRPPTRVWTGQLCTDTTRSSDKQLVSLNIQAPLKNAHTVCVDRGPLRIDYRPNSLRIFSYKNGLAVLHLQCVSKDTADRFIRQNNGKRIAFVFGDTAMSNFRATTKNLPTDWCGKQMFPDLREAIEVCEKVARGWGVSTQGCSTPCDPASNLGVAGICVGYKTSHPSNNSFKPKPLRGSA